MTGMRSWTELERDEAARRRIGWRILHLERGIDELLDPGEWCLASERFHTVISL